MNWFRTNINSDYFSLSKLVKSDKSLKYFLDKIEIDNYYILKSSSNFRFVSIEEVISEKYCRYIFFNKELYSKEYIEMWLEFLKMNKLNILYLSKTFPPQYILDMIKIIETI
jgi:hypothetical protein